MLSDGGKVDGGIGWELEGGILVAVVFVLVVVVVLVVVLVFGGLDYGGYTGGQVGWRDGSDGGGAGWSIVTFLLLCNTPQPNNIKHSCFWQH